MVGVGEGGTFWWVDGGLYRWCGVAGDGGLWEEREWY